jgi:hypothetical protein
MINVLLRYDTVTTIPLDEFYGSTLHRHPGRHQCVPLVVSRIQRNPTSNTARLVSISHAHRAPQASFWKHIRSVECLRQVDQKRRSCRGPARGRDGCCIFNLGKSEEVMGIKFCRFRESLLGTVKVFEDADY